MSYVNLEVSEMEKKSYLVPSLIVRKITAVALLASQSMEVISGDEYVVDDDNDVFSKDIETSDVWED